MIAKNIALIITNTFLLLVILCIRILLSVLVFVVLCSSQIDDLESSRSHLHSLRFDFVPYRIEHHSPRSHQRLRPFRLLFSNVQSTHSSSSSSSSSSSTEDSLSTRLLSKVGLSPRFHYIIDTIGQIEDNPIYQSDVAFITEPQLKYKYDDTLSARSAGASSQPSQSIRSIFDSVVPYSADGEMSSEEDGTKSDRSNSIALSARGLAVNAPSDTSLTKSVLEAGHTDWSRSSTSMTHDENDLTERTTESPVESPDSITDISIQDRCGRSLPCSVPLCGECDVDLARRVHPAEQHVQALQPVPERVRALQLPVPWPWRPAEQLARGGGDGGDAYFALREGLFV